VLRVVYADSEAVCGADRGLAYGDGLFETIRMCGHQALLRRHHLNRLVADAGRLGIDVEYAELDDQLTRAAGRLLPGGKSGSWVLKMILTRGSSGRGYRPPPSSAPTLIVSASPLPAMPGPEGVVARLASFPLMVNPRLAGIKTLNRLEQVMASREFTGEEWELIMADPSGAPVEGTRTNLMVHADDKWITPASDAVAVAGVMRQYAIECLQAAGETIVERSLPARIDLLPGLRGLYLLNSVFGIVSVRLLDSVSLPVEGTLATICDPLKTLE
jgi:4-amino-4-deoxychorismate lyase